MNLRIKRVVCLIMSVYLFAFAQCAFAETWTAKFSQNDLRAVSQETVDMLTARLSEEFGTEDPDTGYPYSFQIAGEAEINGKMWYVGRLSWLVDDHLSLLTDFLMDQEDLRVYDCVYPDSETIACEDDEGGLDPENIGDRLEPVPYLSENGFSLCYDAAFLKPDESDDDKFVAVSGEDVFFTIVVVSDLPKDAYEGFLAEGYGDEEPQLFNIAIDDTVEATCALIERNNRSEYYYLVPFGNDALAISAGCPASEAGAWGARFDLMTESLTF